MKYKCLVLDHDDTVVNSTATIHYPCFIEYLEKYYPALSGNYTLDEYFEKNFDPGITELLRDEIGMDAETLAHEEAYWREYVKDHIPSPYPGISEIITEFRKRGGIVAVSSHSFSGYIERDYRAAGLPMPDIIYGWDIPPEKRKPAPYTLLDIMEKYDLAPSELLMVDDLKPGYDMARAAGVDFAAAGWAYDVPAIEEFMRKNCLVYLPTVTDLWNFLFES